MRKVTDKTHEDFAALTPLRQVRLDFYDRANNNNKFWHGAIYELDHQFYFVRRWGRNGAKGQDMVEVGGRVEAGDALFDVERKKRKEGYANDPSLLDKLAREVAE